MKLFESYRDKLLENGPVEGASYFGITMDLAMEYYERKKELPLSICQKLVDSLDGNIDSEAGEWVDKDGILNGSYVPAEWGIKKKAWEGRDVCLCLPVYNTVPQQHFFTMLCTAMRYKMAMRLEFRGEDSMITRSRNHLARRFLKTGATWSIWFDSDMVFPFGLAGVYKTMTNMNDLPEKFLGVNTIERLISWNKTLVGGCYWDRRGSGRLIAGGGGPLMRPIPSDGLHPIGFVGTGCLAIHRQVFLDIAKKFPDTLSENAIGNEAGFFTNIQTKERMMGEDESFAWRANEAGHPSFLDLGICCGHVGSGNVHGIPVGGSKI